MLKQIVWETKKYIKFILHVLINNSVHVLINNSETSF